MNTKLKRQVLNEVFKQFQRLPEWPTARTGGTTPVEPKRVTLQIPGRAIRKQTTAQSLRAQYDLSHVAISK
jgi:hypothetical protein